MTYVTKFIFLICLILLSGCGAAAVSSPLGPMSGHETWDVACVRSPANCHQEAMARCPQGYDVVNAVDQSRVMYVVSGSAVIPIQRFAMDEVVECRPPAPAIDPVARAGF